MLDKLGNALKKGFDKIAGSVFLDKKTIDSIVKDLQRALIGADVNIHLVKEIGDKIKSEATNEKIKGIERKEHLTKILHDEVLKLLGKEKYELKIEKGKKTKILLLGLYGAGKCVHGDSQINLSNGKIISAKELYEDYISFNEEELEDGKIIDISNKNLLVPSFNPKTLKIENKKVTHLWKLKKEELYEIKVDNGNDYKIKVTPEHPFFILRQGNVKKIRADELTEEDYIAIPKEFKIKGKSINLLEDLKKLDLFTYINSDKIKKIKSGKTLKELCAKLKYKSNYCKFSQDLKKGKIPLELINSQENYLTLKTRGSKKILTIPTYLNENFSEFLGYIIGDGHIEKNYVEVTTENIEVINRLKELSKCLFNINPSIKKDIRTKNLYKVIFSSKTLVKILSIFNLNPGKKGRNLKVPNQIQKSNDDVIKSFIKAYFDCDSSPSKNRRSIEVISESNILIKQISFLLRRFSINSTISKKFVSKNYYWRLVIKSRSAERYAKKIGYLINSKQEKINDYEKIGLYQGCGKEDMIPLGKFLKKLRLSMGFSIGEIQENAVYSYGLYEMKGLISKEQLLKLFYYYTNTKKGIFYKILEDLSNQNFKKKYSYHILNNIIKIFKQENLISSSDNSVCLNKNGTKILKKYQNFNYITSLNNLKNISESNVYWSQISKVSKIKNNEKYVYDLTVEDNHSFLAEGFIVHNTTSAHKLAGYYQKRGFKVAMLGLDVHRPAATDQLEQLGKKIKVPTFTDKSEKDPNKIYKKYSKELEKFDLVIIDTAGRHNLDKELVTEIKDISKNTKPTHTFLVIQADIGQAAKNQAKEFQDAVSINGVIITRMDSTAKAGGALTACNETKAPVYFIGTGEKVNDFETFNPKNFISRLLGMGDLEGLLEHVQSAVDEKSQKNLKKKLEKGDFDLRDFQEQLKQMQGMGSFSKLVEMMPGLGKAKIPENMLGIQESKVKKWSHAIDSMTPLEIKNPLVIEKQTSRLGRIAKGSGTTTTDLRQLLKQYKLLKDMVSGAGDLNDIDPSQGLSQKQMQKLARKFGKKMKF